MNSSTHTDPPAENSSLFLARQVHALRKKAGLTLQQLSRKSDVSVSTLSKIEKGQLSP
ncbi:MAG: helix-turn-helix domain-containing protein, partial [Neisseria sp.]|nr:helix-turn-helix domain-containing protein [Neisseria sp.]